MPLPAPSGSHNREPAWVRAVINWLRDNAAELDKTPKTQLTINRSGGSVSIERKTFETVPVEHEN